MNIHDLPEAALLEQYAEECVEAAHASLKYARLLRGDNPTPVPEEQVKVMLVQEHADVLVAAGHIGMLLEARLDGSLKEIASRKEQRWQKRLEGIND